MKGLLSRNAEGVHPCEKKVNVCSQPAACDPRVLRMHRRGAAQRQRYGGEGVNRGVPCPIGAARQGGASLRDGASLQRTACEAERQSAHWRSGAAGIPPGREK